MANKQYEQSTLDKFIIGGAPRKSPFSEEYKGPILGVHYEKSGSTKPYTWSCKECSFEIAHDSGYQIKNHCRTKNCYPNLKKAFVKQVTASVSRKPEVYKQHDTKRRKIAYDMEKACKEAGQLEQYECDRIGCGAKFHSHRLFAIHKAQHVSTAMTQLGSYFANLEEPILLKEAQTESQESATSSELRRTEDIETLLRDREHFQPLYTTYFVIIVNKEAKVTGLHEYIKMNLANPNVEIKTYVGKRTVYRPIEMDIADDHNSRSQSTIVELCKSGENVAFEIARHFHNSKEEMEAEESFYQLLGKFRDATPNSTTGVQWTFCNKRLESIPVACFTRKRKLDAQQLGRSNHPMVCVNDCGKKHVAVNIVRGEERERDFCGMLHLDEPKLLNITTKTC